MNMHRIIVAATVAVVSFGALADVYVDEYGSWQYEKLLDEKSEPYAAVITGYYPGETPHSTVKTPASINIEKTEGAPPRYIPVCQIKGGRPNCDDFVIRGHGDLVISGSVYANWTDGPTNLVLQGVKTIGHFYETGAFRGNTRLETVEADSSLDLIEQYAFDACPNLRSFTGATGLSEIQTRAFQNCTALELPPLNSGLKTIGDNAFNGCASLCEVNIPDSVTSVGSASFVNCPSVTNITFHSGYSPIGAGLFSPEQMAGLQALTICGNGETVVKDAAFNKYPMHHLMMTGVKEIHNFYSTGPFQDCTNLETVMVDSRLAVLPTHAFAGCTSLRSVTGATGLTAIRDCAFLNCTSLETISLPNGLETIESDVFNGCASLREVYIPDTVTTIGGGAWRYCSSITNISFGSGYSPIDTGRFSPEMPNLDTVTVRGSGETVVGWDAFKGFPMRRLVLTGVTTLDGNSHGWGACQNCTNLETVAADETLELINVYAFDGCKSLKRVSGATGLTTIGGVAFRNCAALEEMPLPEGLATIGNDAFNGCASLKNVHIPDSVATIGGWAWRYCSSITNISFGAGYSPIYAELFSLEMPDLQTLTIRGSGTTVCSWIAFKGFPMRHVAMTGVATVEGEIHERGAFQNCTNLVTVTADGTLKLIDIFAFDGCKSLESITGMTGLTTIGNLAFRNCKALKSVVLPSTLTAMNDGFNSCALEQMVFLGTPPNCSTTFDASCRGYYVGNTAAWQAALSGGKWHGMTMAPAGYVPEEKGGGKGILITEAWLDELDAEFGAGTSTTFKQKFGEDISTAIYELTGKVTIEREQKPVWHDYVTGTNPVDLDSLFRAFITMEGTTPNVTYDPVRADRVYRLWGTNDLGGEWVELAPGEEPDYHFFKATVEMP